MNPLVNVLTPKVRAVLYAALFVVSLAFAAFEAADGDWLKAIGLLVTSLLGATAASNASWTPTDTTPPVHVEPEPPVSGNGASDDYGYRGEHRA
jgi:hypothetical protein